MDLALQMAVLEKGVNDMNAEAKSEKKVEQGLKIKHVAVLGYVGSTPDVIKNDDGDCIKFRLGVKNQANETDWISVNVDVKNAAGCSDTLRKGNSVYISGKMYTFSDPETGRVTRQVLYANRIYRS